LEGLGAFIIALGIWITYCGYKGTDAAKLGLAILADPSNAGKAITEANLEAAQRMSGLTAGDPNAPRTGQGSAGNTSAVVLFARAQVGKRYVLGGAGPNVWDCSGLVMKAYEQIGIKVPHSALAQSLRGTRLTHKSQLQAGDLLFPTGRGVAALGDHVQIYSGSGTIIEAANEKVGVREIGLEHWWPGERVTANRYVITGTGKETAQTPRSPGAKPGTGKDTNNTARSPGASTGSGTGGTMRTRT
jgi:cell wall-associated NlpC family hydrolase